MGEALRRGSSSKRRVHAEGGMGVGECIIYSGNIRLRERKDETIITQPRSSYFPCQFGVNTLYWGFDFIKNE